MSRPAVRPNARRPARRSWLKRLVLGCFLLLIGWYAACILGLVYLRSFPALTTGVQVERRVESWFNHSRYAKQYQFVPLNRISRELQRTVVAAEDTAFYQHHGIDWAEMEKVVDEANSRGRVRGGSTITQQLVKNLFLTTSRSVVRKAAEYALVYPAEQILGKRRILELYLNVIEWGPGVYGAEAAAQYHYKTEAANLSRDQAARLAAIIPAPRTRRPARMNDYAAEILSRMERLGI